MSIAMPDLRYHRPATLEEAVDLKRAADEAVYLSGGHTLLPAVKAGLAAPTALIDLRAIPQLGAGVSVSDGMLRISAATTHAAVAASALVLEHIPVLAALAGSIGDVQVRNWGTLGGSLANNDPAADYPAAALALGATIITDRRRCPAEAFFDGLYTTCLEDDEIVVEVSFPVPLSAGYAKFRNPASGFAMAAVFVAQLAGDAVRCAVTGAGDDGVFRWKEAEEALGRDFSAAALDGLEPDASAMLADLHAEPDYRAHLVAVMARRAVSSMGRLTLHG
ncbi:MAG: FAD binding domain-containing protein [Nannocystaceae bacterium]